MFAVRSGENKGGGGGGGGAKTAKTKDAEGALDVRETGRRHLSIFCSKTSTSVDIPEFELLKKWF